MVDLGGRTRRRRQPNDEPAAADPVVAVLAFVVAHRRSNAPWARAFRYYVIAAGLVVVSRIVFRCVFSSGITASDHIILHLPHVPTPSWYAGIQIGGPVSLEATLSAAVDGLRLGTLLCCIGAANALANPKRALRVLPGALYELGIGGRGVDQPRPATDRERSAGRPARDGCEADAGAAGGPCRRSRSRFWTTRSTAR